MTITLHGPAASSYVRSARMTCLEKGLTHTLEPVAFGTEAHAGLHPWKRVPILRDGDVTIYETSAIMRYLDEVGPGPSLLPSTPAARAVMEQWISAINCYIYDSLIRKYALEYIAPRLAGRDPDPEKIRAGVPVMERDVARLETAYGRSTYVAGDTPSLVDLLVAPIVQTVGLFPEGKRALAAAPNLSRAYDKLRARPSFEVVHAGLLG